MTERGEDINNVTSLETTSQAGRRASEGALSQKLGNQDLRAVMNWTTLTQWPRQITDTFLTTLLWPELHQLGSVHSC